MDLVDEQHVAVFEIGEEAARSPALGDHRSRRRAEIHAELARHDLGERRLAETRRPANSTWSSASRRPRGIDEHLEI